MNDIVAAHADTAIHVILDNLNTHKPRNDRCSGATQRSFPLHANPGLLAQSGGIWFSILQGQSLHGASFTSVKQLREHIDAFIKAYNPRRSVAWIKSEVHQKRLKPRSRINDSGTSTSTGRYTPTDRRPPRGHRRPLRDYCLRRSVRTDVNSPPTPQRRCRPHGGGRCSIRPVVLRL